MASNQGPAASEYHKERDMGFNSWNNNDPSAGGGGATLASSGVPGGSWGSLLRHHPTWELLPVLLLIPRMDLMKRI